MSGYSLRTARRAINQVRASTAQARVVLRTVNMSGKWQVIASTPDRLQSLSRPEPFLCTKTGKKQVVKTSKGGSRITQQQRRISEQAAHWGNEYSIKGNIPDIHQAEKNPDQLELGLEWAGRPHRKTKCHFPIGRTREALKSRRNKHGQAPYLSLKQRKLAFYLARRLRDYHWDNCKIAYEVPHAFVYAKWALARGCKRGQVLGAWRVAVEEMHASAVDLGEVDPGVWPPSSTYARAKKILVEQRCPGSWLN